MKAWFQRFMSGRYGSDQFGKFLSMVSLVLLILGLFLGSIPYWLGLFLLLYCYFRMFSRNISKRYAENQKYLVWEGKFRRHTDKYKLRFSQRKTYRYFRCPHCKQELRVPRGRGRISINCPKCGTSFIKKS